MSRLLQYSGWCNSQNIIKQYDLLLLKACACMTLPLLRKEVIMLKYTTATTSATIYHIICSYLIFLAQILCVIVRHGGRNMHKFPIAW